MGTATTEPNVMHQADAAVWDAYKAVRAACEALDTLKANIGNEEEQARVERIAMSVSEGYLLLDEALQLGGEGIEDYLAWVEFRDVLRLAATEVEIATDGTFTDMGAVKARERFAPDLRRHGLATTDAEGADC